MSRHWLRRLRNRERARATTGCPSWWERHQHSLEVLRAWTEAIGALIVALMAIQQYKENSSAEQVNKTLKYLDRFREDRVFSARRALEDAWTAKRDEVFALTESQAGESALARYVTDTIEKEKLEPAIATVMDFYDELEACTSADLCDRATAVRFFGKYAWDFHGLMHPYIEAQRAALHDGFIGVGIDQFSRAYRDIVRRRESTARNGASGAAEASGTGAAP